MFHPVSLNNPEGVLSTDSVSDLKMIGVFRRLFFLYVI